MRSSCLRATARVPSFQNCRRVIEFLRRFFYCPPHRKSEIHASPLPQKISAKSLSAKILPISLRGSRISRLLFVLPLRFQDFASAWGEGVSPLRGSLSYTAFTAGLRPRLTQMPPLRGLWRRRLNRGSWPVFSQQSGVPGLGRRICGRRALTRLAGRRRRPIVFRARIALPTSCCEGRRFRRRRRAR